MRYSLVVYKDLEEPFEIQGFSTISVHENLDENSLNDIIKFTNEFKSEEELMEILIRYGLVPKNFITGNFAIYYYKSKDSEPKMLRYGISFQEDQKFFDISYLKYYYSRNLTKNSFMEDFLERYYVYLKSKNVFSELLSFIRYGYEANCEGKELSEEEQDYRRYCMEKFVMYYTRKKDSKGKYKPSASGIRDLAMFAIDFERKYVKGYKVSKFKNENYLANLEAQLSHYEMMIQTNGLSEEEYDAYMKAIMLLQEEIALISDSDYKKERRLSNETSTN